MPLSIDNVIQVKTGSFDGASGSATLDSGTTAGNTVVIFAMYGANGSSTYELLTPSGFVLAAGISGTTTTRKAVPKVFVKNNISAGQTSWTLSMSPTAGQVAWVAIELTGVGLDPTAAYYIAVSSPATPYNGSSPSTQTSETTPTTTCFDSMAFAVHAARSDTTTPPAWSGQTNNFTELAEVSQVNATNGVSLAVSYLPTLALKTFESTATLSPASPATGTMIAFYADGSTHAPNYDACYGAEIGTFANMNVGSAAMNTKVFDNVNGTVPTVTTTNARKYGDGTGGNYCGKFSTISAISNVEWTSSGVLGVYAPTTGYPVVERLHRYFDSLPGADTEIHSVDAGSTGTLTIWYRSASQKLGVKIGTGTEILSDATISAGKWIGIDYRYDPRIASHTCDWQVDYDSLDNTGPVVQTQAVGAGTTIQDVTAVRRGWQSARTATMYFDDEVLSKNWGSYPIGDLTVVPLGPDPSGSPSITGGAEANFKVMTSNGTMGTWNAANARNALDEIPPVVGASADGIAQVTVDLTNYAIVPMDTKVCAPNYIPRALRWYIAGWAASTQPANVKVFSYDGISENNLFPDADHGFDNSTFVWLCKMQRDASDSSYYLLTQAKLNAMELRMGQGSDLTPDAGILNATAELVLQKPKQFNVLWGTAEFSSCQVDIKMDMLSYAIISLIGTSSGRLGMTMFWTIKGVDGSHYVPGYSTWEMTTDATSIEDVTYLGMLIDH